MGSILPDETSYLAVAENRPANRREIVNLFSIRVAAAVVFTVFPHCF